LLIEDAPADVELLERELRKGGLEFRARQVDSREAFLHELQHDPPDVILSDHGLPSFDGFTALALTRDRCPEVPFIFVTNSLGEEKAIEAFESGADDCVLKGRLSKLVPAVHRALRKAEERRVWKLVEADRERIVSELHDAVAKAKTPAVEDRSALFSPGQSTMGEGGEGHKHLLPICAHCKKIRDSADAWHTLEIYFRKHFDVEFTHGLCPDCVPLFFPGPLTRK
jgi:CheY-like chemotaxis protein